MSIRRILGRAAAAAFAAALMVSAGLFFDPASAASLEVQGDNGADSSMPVYLTQEALKPADMLVTEQVTLTGTTATCSLKAQQQGFASDLSLLYPADIAGNGVYALIGYQEISGLYRADALGYMINTLQWQNGRFALTNQMLGVLGTQA